VPQLPEAETSDEVIRVALVLRSASACSVRFFPRRRSRKRPRRQEFSVSAARWITQNPEFHREVQERRDKAIYRPW
jgi:hypothetical protein